jgi:membrane protein YqaA with SNARE-associated domain
MRAMLRRLYDWTLSLAQSPHAMWAIAVVSFLESSIFPIPPHALLIPMVLARPTAWARIALVCASASVLGGLLGYAIGALAFDQIGKPVLEMYGYSGRFTEFSDRYNAFGAWAVLIAGITPFPFKIITILSGTTGLSLAVFTISSIIARFAIFFLIAALLWKVGPPIRAFIERRLGLVTVVFTILLVGGFVAAGYML